tara:strand:+ start:462 stop:668 length:207 start_codon:yes stop_codon:yes gene_type:complete
MNTEWGVDESLCIYCRKHWTKYDIDAGVLSLGRIKRYIKCDINDRMSNHCTDQVCMDCYEKEGLGLLE